MLLLNENSQIQVTDVKTIQIETYLSISMIPEKLATKHSKILTVGFDKKYTWSLHEVCRGVLLVLIIRRINCINTTSGICHSVSVTISCAGLLGK
jgi:hypothetical protein